MNEERFAKEMKKIQSVISRALQKANTLTAVADGATGWSSSSRPGISKSQARAGCICRSARFCRTAGTCPQHG